MFISKLSPEQWAEARQLRAGGVAFAAIAERFGLMADTVRCRARKEGWPSPSDPAPGSQAPADFDFVARARPKASTRRRAATSVARPRRFAASRSTSQVRRSLARRLLRIFDIELTLMELRMTNRLKDARDNPHEEPAAVTETELRRVQSIIKTIDEVTELEADTDPSAGAEFGASGASKSAAARAAASEADVFRREIAERIAKLIPPS